jgi:hypothetical protein
MAMGDLNDLLSKIVNLDARLRALEKIALDHEDRVSVVEDHTINHENRLQDLEEDDDE